MTEGLAAILAAAVSLFGSIVMGLVAHGWRSDLATLRAEMGTHQADVRARIAESAIAFYDRVNGNYVKKDLFNTLVGRIDGIEQRVTDGE